VGSPHAGKLVAGEKMPPGPGYIIKQPQLAYGTSELITGVIQCVAHVQRSFEDTPDLVMGHLSRKGGGKLFPHKSHQSGRDIDIGYYHRKLSPHNFVKATHANLDVRRTASFLECLVDSGDVKYVFINTYIQKVLYHHFKKRKFTAEFLTTVFQYPHEGGKQLGIVRHEKGHDDHMHVRFFCPEGDSACHN
jgi:murein endopeptidase